MMVIIGITMDVIQLDILSLAGLVLEVGFLL